MIHFWRLCKVYRQSFLLPILYLLLISCDRPEKVEVPAPGVPLELAENRASRIEALTYAMPFDLPAATSMPVTGRLDLAFELSDPSRALALDFTGAAGQVTGIWKEGRQVKAIVKNQHIVLPAACLKAGPNEFRIDFTAGDMSLNRSDDYLYTLLVPDRARTVFPCFDQPDLKARFRLSLSMPGNWIALANGRQTGKRESGGRVSYAFAETLPIPTYLFAFCAGRFQVRSGIRAGRKMTMLYRETDSVKVSRNAPEIFDLHAQALHWLEEYTSFPLPFPKLDFALLPGFQYGGMEHVGAIFYKEPSLMLDESATENQKLNRARLIAHETAHMWFGDLVTMKWFDDVWLKEVFANFMAAKVVNPAFPDINHELSFLMAHQPAAYAEDRSGGTHPIQQALENLKDAGTLYGRIIYQKAPVVMRQLEVMTGPEAFRDGLRKYLSDFAFRNATWDDLLAILDRQTEADLKAWSETWVKEAGMPELHCTLADKEGRIEALVIHQIPKAGNSRGYWAQHAEMALLYTDSIARLPFSISGATSELKNAANYPVPLAVLPNASEMAYGYFRPDGRSRDYLLEKASEIPDPLLRGAAWLSLYEATVRDDIPHALYLAALRRALPAEREPLNRQNLIANLNTMYWMFATPEERQALGPEMEKLLWSLTLSARDIGAKSAYFRAYQHFAQTPDAVDRLYLLWREAEIIPGLPLSENDRTTLAENLALRLPDQAEGILDWQFENIKNPDRRKRLAFIRPALSPVEAVRDSFFESLKKEENRQYEPWVVDAVGYLHHPLRAWSALKYIRPSLELLEELQATGDIFFPRQWIGATLNGHQSPEAAAIVRDFLEERPDYPYRLRNKILMAADLLFRATSEKPLQ